MASDSPRGAGGGGSLQVGRLLGIPLRVHWSFLLLVVFVLAVESDAGWRAAAAGLAWVGALFGFVVAHELAHCVVARRRGAEVLGILLIPLGGISQLASVPDDPDDELAIAAAGPLASLAAGVVLLVVGLVTGARVWPPTLFAGSWWARLAWLNLLLGAFNLLPALPMDGGRVLRAVLARHHGHVEATLLAARIARYLAGTLAVVGFLYDFWLVLIAAFVYLGAVSEEQAVRRHRGPPGRGGHDAHDHPGGAGVRDGGRDAHERPGGDGSDGRPDICDIGPSRPPGIGRTLGRGPPPATSGPPSGQRASRRSALDKTARERK